MSILYDGDWFPTHPGAKLHYMRAVFCGVYPYTDITDYEMQWLPGMGLIEISRWNNWLKVYVTDWESYGGWMEVEELEIGEWQ